MASMRSLLPASGTPGGRGCARAEPASAASSADAKAAAMMHRRRVVRRTGIRFLPWRVPVVLAAADAVFRCNRCTLGTGLQQTDRCRPVAGELAPTGRVGAPDAKLCDRSRALLQHHLHRIAHLERAALDHLG